MNNTRNPLLKNARSVAVAVVILLAAACSTATQSEGPGRPQADTGPAGHAVALLIAVTNNDWEIAEAWMATSALMRTSYCGEIAFTCMHNEWKGAGSLDTISSSSISQTSNSAIIELRMTWSGRGTVCQRFRLVFQENDWKVEYVEAPSKCLN